MGEIVVRKAIPEEAAVITGFLRSMVKAMAAVGAPTPVYDKKKWQDIQDNIASAISHNERLYLLAEYEKAENKPVGFIEASIFSIPVLIEPRKVLHIHSLYVVDAERRKGVATELMKHMLIAGQERGCTEAGLDTLVANPARGLFEKLGFCISEHNMKKFL
jgi:ribosomal protein S18 acetylase RimI-like enzyme